jgi:tetratricopeptide (TPR) repeat protein
MLREERQTTRSDSRPDASTRQSAARFGDESQTKSPRTPGRTLKIGLLAVGVLVMVGIGLVFADWYSTVPAGAVPQYVGREKCIDCHQEEYHDWLGSDHDLAMDPATDETVLADFNDVELEKFGIKSRAFRKDGKFMFRAEGPDGEMRDYEVKWVFGVRPLQQYMIEIERLAAQPERELGRVQVLRWSWDTEKKEWFYLMPPDVDERILPEDPLHWTQLGSNWNHMCADCHSTDLRKNHDPVADKYHTTFAEIDVSCEACHGPGSIHVDLAEKKWFFWDRKLKYGLPELKSEDPNVERDTCFRCHSRRRVLKGGSCGGQDFYDNMVNELLRPHTYYADGQILDEVYVHGSFIQSKMYDQGVRCSDCHNVHSGKVHHADNQLCTDCHMATHEAGKYDTPAHHFHEEDGTGALCVECHMPESTYMAVDPRRDHSMRVPRPDLSVKYGLPNACTRCHLERAEISDEKRASLKGDYGMWMRAVRDGDEEIRKELAKIDQWALEHCREWYGTEIEETPSFAPTLEAGWRGDVEAQGDLLELAKDKLQPPMIRATALTTLGPFDNRKMYQASLRALDDPHPLVRAAAVGNLAGLSSQGGNPAVADLAPEASRQLTKLLADPSRLVRTEAARVLVWFRPRFRSRSQRQAYESALDEYIESLRINSDQAGSHLTLGALYEARGSDEDALEAYETAMRIQPRITGPRSNLAALLERMGKPDEAEKLRKEELAFLERDVKLVPDNAGLQYHLGMALYNDGQNDRSQRALEKAVELDANAPQYHFGLAMFYEKFEAWDKALVTAERAVELRPDNVMYQNLLQRIKANMPR